MNTFVRLSLGAGACLGLMNLNAAAVTNTIGSGQTVEMNNGDYYDRVVIESGGTLVMNGGAIGTNPALFEASVEIQSGGRFVMNGGEIKYFDNSGTVESYGGFTSDISSAGYAGSHLKVAGGNLGSQLVLFGGTVDMYYTASNAPNLEIDSDTMSASCLVHFFSVTNTLAPGTYQATDLSPIDTNAPPEIVAYTDHAEVWTPSGTRQATVYLTLITNWSGEVISETFTSPVAAASSIDEGGNISWVGGSGTTYQVQSNSNLIDGLWTDLGDPVESAGTTDMISGSTSHDAEFYRVTFVHL